jgi:tRNA-2-methylthio-N6-dimethylallyladenosine synthase
LSDLLVRIHDTPGIERIKFITNFPKDMTDDLLHAVRDLPKVCPYLHVPAQSGCDEMLKRMKRMYTVEFYRDMLARCREIVPGVAISSDFIVGFSGETEASFAKTCDLVREANFKNSFIFKYSPRPGTRGHELYADDVPEDVKKRRNNDLLAIQNAVSLKDHRRLIGERVEVLVEGPSKNAWKNASGPVQLTGRTRTDHIAVFDGNPRLGGATVEIDIVDASSFTLYGRVVTGEQVASAEGCCETPSANRERIALPLVG